MFPNGQKRNRIIRSTLQIHPPVIKPLRLLLADPRTGSTSRTAENTFHAAGLRFPAVRLSIHRHFFPPLSKFTSITAAAAAAAAILDN